MPDFLEKPYHSYAQYLNEKYGYRIYRVGVDAGFTCPNRLRSAEKACQIAAEYISENDRLQAAEQTYRAAGQCAPEAGRLHPATVLDIPGGGAVCNDGVISEESASYKNIVIDYSDFGDGVISGDPAVLKDNIFPGGGCVYCDALGARAAYLRQNESGYTHRSGFVSDIDLRTTAGGKQAAQNSCSKQTAPDIDRKLAFSDSDRNKPVSLDIEAQIKRGIEFLMRRYKAEHFALYFQAFSNTFAPVDRLREIYSTALSGRKWEGLIVSTRPDCLDEARLDLLAGYLPRTGSVCVELGLQSGDNGILKKMNRGHNAECFEAAAGAVKSKGLELCVHVLLGFPGEGPEQLEKTAQILGRVRPDFIKIHNLNIASGTKLFNDYLDGEVTAPCAERYIASCVYLLRRIPAETVVERLLCETPSHRLAAPLGFPDKNSFLRRLENYMNNKGYRQGDLYL